LENKGKLDEYIKENLEKGYIRPSKSQYSSPFFFVGKKGWETYAQWLTIEAKLIHGSRSISSSPYPRTSGQGSKMHGYILKMDVQCRI
jgi:hypothetical protein